jgi:hypothetical protein
MHSRPRPRFGQGLQNCPMVSERRLRRLSPLPRYAGFAGAGAPRCSTRFMAKTSRGRSVFLVLAVAACGGQSSGNHVGQQLPSLDNQVTPSCSWPSSLDPSEASTGQCLAASFLLLCRGPSGGTQCLSNSPMNCSMQGDEMADGASSENCMNLCNTKEYALSCGGPGPTPSPPPPAGCRPLSAGPGGGTIACCPCGK